MLWLWLCVAMLTAALPAAASTTGDRVETMLRAQGLTGATWMLLDPERGVVTEAAGVRRAGGAPVQPEDRFQVGSIAKPVMAAGVLRLVAQGRVSLDTPVVQLLPRIALDNPWERTHPVRLRHLLDHTAGLEDAGLSLVMSTTAKADQPLAAMFAGRDMRLPVRTRPGSEYSYSNLGYVLVAMIIERIAGQRYEAFLDAELLRPLGMRASSFDFVPASDPGATGPAVVHGHVDGARPHPNGPLHLRPAGLFLTTSADMGAFARFLLGDGSIDGVPFIDAGLLRQMGRVRGTVAADAGLEAGYALGLWRRDRHGAIGLCHEGSTVGFRAMLCLYPDDGKAFFIAFNMDSETADYGAFDALMIRQLGLAPAAATPAADTIDDPSPWLGWYARLPGKMPAFEYFDVVLNPVRIADAGDGLTLQPLFAEVVPLTPVGGRRYRAQDRIDASHILLEGRDGPEWSNGYGTYRKVPTALLVAYWINLALGLAGVSYLLVVGAWRLLRRARAFPADPFGPVWLAIVAMVLGFALVGLSWARMGDQTAATGLLAVATAALLLAAAWGLWRVFRGARERPPRVRHRDAWPLIAVLQWCAVLAVWGLLPLRTWA
jgi:CubicO group peptidase (beta-lactamase class C family)